MREHREMVKDRTSTGWLLGREVTRVERRIVALVSGLAVAAVIAAFAANDGGATDGAAWWVVVLAVVLAVDVVGGIPANASNAAKRLYHGPVPEDAGRFGRLVHDHVTFTALHVHPIVVGLLVPGARWWWGPLWYAVTLSGVVLVRRTPVDHQRVVAFAVVAAALMLATITTSPPGFGWLPLALVLKLVAAHAVEEPIREVV
ncbi:MAG: hypothetical protein ACLFUG_02270 [Nitriliruptoraceae bacterium]